MAVRRQWGAKLGDLSNLLLRAHLQRKEAEYTSGLVGARQREAAQQAAQNSILEKAKSDPAFASRLSDRWPGNLQVGGIPISSFVPSQTEDIQDVAKGIGDISELGKLPTETDIHAQLHAKPGYPSHTDTEDRVPIEQLMAQVASRTDALKSSVQPTMMDTVTTNTNGTTTPTKIPVNPWNAPKEGIQTGPNPLQAGLNAGYQQESELNTPGLTQSKITQHNLFSSGTEMADAHAAGMKSGSERRAVLAEDWAPQIVAKKFDYESKLLQAQLMKSLNYDQMKEVNEMTNTLSTLIPQAEEIRQLSSQVNTRTPNNILGRVKPVIGGMLGSDPIAAKLAAKQQSMALKMANTIGGNKGQVSENDANAMKAFIPGPFDSDELAQSKLADLATLFEALPQVMGQMNIQESPQMRIQKATTMFNVIKAVKQAGK